MEGQEGKKPSKQSKPSEPFKPSKTFILSNLSHITMNVSYIKDKGRKLHFHGLDPKKIRLDAKEKFNMKAKQDYFGASPNLFVGKFGYPNINVGIMNVEDYQKHDEPLTWVKDKTTIPEIIDLRTQLVNSTFRANIKTFDNKLLEISQEISLASKPVDVEINLTKKPNLSLTM